MKIQKVKAKELKEGDYVLDKDDIKCLVAKISPFDEFNEMLLLLNDCEGGPSRIGSVPKEELVKRIMDNEL